jgi:hypothetical protein
MEEGLDASSAVMFVTGWGYARKPASTTIDRECTPECGRDDEAWRPCASATLIMIAVLRVMRAVGWSVVGLYLLSGLFFILLVSLNPYEWMIGETLPGDLRPLTHCTLPVPSDDVSDLGILIVPLVAAGAGIGLSWRKTNIGRAVLVSAGLLGVYAVYKFYLRSIFC